MLLGGSDIDHGWSFGTGNQEINHPAVLESEAMGFHYLGVGACRFLAGAVGGPAAFGGVVWTVLAGLPCFWVLVNLK